MLTLATYLSSEGISSAEFARRMAARIGRPVSDQNVWRWTREPSHGDYSIPEPINLVGIYFETGGQVKIETWYQHLLGRMAKRRRPGKPVRNGHARA